MVSLVLSEMRIHVHFAAFLIVKVCRAELYANPAGSPTRSFEIRPRDHGGRGVQGSIEARS